MPQGYNLAALGPPENGGIANVDAANLVDSKLAAGVYLGTFSKPTLNELG
jgi:hypothetical protein